MPAPARFPLRCRASHRLTHKQIEGGYFGHTHYVEGEPTFCTFPLATEADFLPGDLPCHYCTVMPGITKDHIVPKSKRGSYAEYNLVPACGGCNGRKRDRMPTCRCEICTYALHRWMHIMGLTDYLPSVDPRHPTRVNSELEETG